jgi:hypothetical protein
MNTENETLQSGQALEEQTKDILKARSLMLHADIMILNSICSIPSLYPRFHNVRETRLVMKAIEQYIITLEAEEKEINKALETISKKVEPYEVLTILYKAKADCKKLQKLCKVPTGIYEIKETSESWMDSDENPTVETYNLFRIKPYDTH